jgi:hypothetical protein
MRFKSTLICLALLGGLAASAAQAQKLDVKPGLWEVTMPALPKPVQVCYTAEVLNGGFTQTQSPPGLQCKNDIKQVSPRVLTVHTVCTGNMAMEGDIRVEATSREAMVMHSKSVMTVSGKKQNAEITANYKWLKADCGNVKPFDPKHPFQQ